MPFFFEIVVDAVGNEGIIITLFSSISSFFFAYVLLPHMAYLMKDCIFSYHLQNLFRPLLMFRSPFFHLLLNCLIMANLSLKYLSVSFCNVEVIY